MSELLTRKQNRLPNYDYSSTGIYFVTICSNDRKNIFAEFDNKNIVGTGLVPVRIELTKIGEIIDKQWRDIANHCHNVEIDEFIVMPNHIHGIIIINKQDGANNRIATRTSTRTAARAVPAISNIIGSFKSRCAVEYLTFIKENDLNVSGQIWQRSFYDHIIRNERSLHSIREYILQNPENWVNDKENINKTL